MDVYLQHLEKKHKKKFLQSTRLSQAFHHPWIYPPVNDQEFLAYLRRYESPDQLSFLVFSQEDLLVGVLNFNDIVRGGYQSCSMAYYMMQGFQQKGYMKKAAIQGLRYVFSVEGLNRVEANIQPLNHASIAFVRSLAFCKEGFSKKFLKIADNWCDHERWALLAENFQYQNL